MGTKHKLLVLNCKWDDRKKKKKRKNANLRRLNFDLNGNNYGKCSIWVKCVASKKENTDLSKGQKQIGNKRSPEITCPVYGKGWKRHSPCLNPTLSICGKIPQKKRGKSFFEKKKT
jgi:hypothetical protein